MQAKTRYFGEVDIDESKIFDFETGIIGFENLRKFTLIHNSEDGGETSVEWLQSLEDPFIALPLLNPNSIVKDYNPEVEDELLKDLGELKPENTYVFVSLTVPSDITKMSINLKAPFIINSDTRKGCQVITESDHPVKMFIYDILQKKEEKGE